MGEKSSQSCLRDLCSYFLAILKSSTPACVQNLAGDRFSQRNPLSLPDRHETRLGDRNICSSHAMQLLTLIQSLLRRAQDLP